MRTGIDTYGPYKLRLQMRGIEVPEGPLSIPNDGAPDSCIQVLGDPSPDVVTRVLVEDGRGYRHMAIALGSLAGMNLVAHNEVLPGNKILEVSES